jgi:hypothetical protein
MRGSDRQAILSSRLYDRHPIQVSAMKEKLISWLIALAVLSPVWLSIAALVGVLVFNSTRLWYIYLLVVIVLFVVGVGFAGDDYEPKRRARRTRRRKRQPETASETQPR